MGTARVSDSLARPILADPSAGDRVLPADTWPVRWARHDGLELGALEAAVSCTRTRTREVLREWGLPPVALEPGAAEEHGRGLLLVGGLRRAASCQPRTAATVPGVRVAAMRVAGHAGGRPRSAAAMPAVRVAAGAATTIPAGFGSPGAAGRGGGRRGGWLGSVAADGCGAGVTSAGAIATAGIDGPAGTGSGAPGAGPAA
jgi:hypothetical protein